MKNILFAVAAVVALSACATGPTLSDQQRLAIHQAHAGAPVNSFSHFGSLHSWEPLGDSALTVWVRPQTAYLLTLTSDCPNLEDGHRVRGPGQRDRERPEHADPVPDREDPATRCKGAQGRRARGTRRASGVFWRDVTGRLFGIAAEQELQHLGFEEGAVLRVHR